MTSDEMATAKTARAAINVCLNNPFDVQRDDAGFRFFFQTRLFRVSILSDSNLLAKYWDDQLNYEAKSVIRSGAEIRCSRDGAKRAQFSEWVLPNVFAPYKTEYELGLEFGSLWDDWVDGMRKEIAELAGAKA